VTAVVIKEIECKKAIGKCGFPGGGLAINPYVGCAHGCVYCYARFIKRFTKHTEEWGSFVDARGNIAARVSNEIKNIKDNKSIIYIGTVTDPYQPLESHYKLTRSVLENLVGVKNPVSVLTKSSLVVRDMDILKKIDCLDVTITLNNLDERWTLLTEPGSTPIGKRLEAIQKLSEAGITVYAMMGPWWPFFSRAEELLLTLKNAGVSGVFSESVNTIGGNWTGVHRILKNFYPDLLPKMEEILFDPDKFHAFHKSEAEKIRTLAKQLKLQATIYFGQGHAANKLKQ